MDTIKSIRADLIRNSDEKTRISCQRFFKEKVICHGVKSAVVGKIASLHWKTVKGLCKKRILDACEGLLKSGYCEEAFIAANWLPRISDRFEESDLAIFERWIGSYIDNWAKCDSFCNHALGDFFMKYPSKAAILKEWAISKNRWMRRAAAVSLIVPAKRGMFLKEAFDISDILLSDKDDMVQKGYGWLLKEQSRTRQKEVFDYVMRKKDAMPRIALRYAIELMPEGLRNEAMQK
jgi:3-methyladenine DNA glycosylase AlkD